MSESALPDVVLHDEIFLRLCHDGDVFDLYRCAATCRRWRRLVASSSILRRPWPSSLVGFFVRQCHLTRVPGTIPADAGTPLAFVPSAELYGGSSPPLRRLSSFVGDGPEYLDDGVPLASRGSLLLVRLFPGDHDPEPYVARLRLAVCDLVAGTCHRLPELDCGCRFPEYVGSYGYAILSHHVRDDPDEAHHQLPPTFRVLIIGQDKHKEGYNLHVFSSDKLAWSTHGKCFNTMEGQALSMLRSEAVVCRGYAHWLFSSVSNFHVLNIEVQTGNVSLTKVSSPTPGNQLNVQDNYTHCNGNAIVSGLISRRPLGRGPPYHHSRWYTVDSVRVPLLPNWRAPTRDVESARN
jgi:hypothetical protein